MCYSHGMDYNYMIILFQISLAFGTTVNHVEAVSRVDVQADKGTFLQ